MVYLFSLICLLLMVYYLHYLGRSLINNEVVGLMTVLKLFDQEEKVNLRDSFIIS